MAHEPPRPESRARRRRGRRLPRRYAQLLIGLALYGASLGFLLRAGLGLAPWDVLHQGLARRSGFSVGEVVIAMSFVVLLAWIPLRERPGVGTLANAVLVGVVVDLTLALLPAPEAWGARISLLVLGVLGNGLATALYIGASLGPGPRDGLMTGVVRRTGRSVRVVRTGLEATVLLVGVLLGGTIGVGTVLYALAIGPLAHALLPHLTVTLPPPPEGVEGGRAPVRPRSSPDVA